MRFLSLSLIALGLLPVQILASDTLSTDYVSTCLPGSDVEVQELRVTYTRSTRIVDFTFYATSRKVQNVTASLTVSAYGNQVYSRDFDPCSPDSYVEQLCPVPATTFKGTGTQEIPEEYANQIPSIAFSIPDLDGLAKLELKSKDDGNTVACIQTGLSNGKSMKVQGVTYAAVGVAGAALALSGLSAIGTVGHAGVSSASPGFTDVMGWFHSMATNGMLSVGYPAVYRSFTKNFAFSTGLIPWGDMQTSIDRFREATGGNLTENSYQFLRNATLEFSSGSSTNTTSKVKRGLNLIVEVGNLVTRDVSASFDDNSTPSNSTSSDDSGFHKTVSGIGAYAEQLTIPQANTFMTVLLIFAIVVAAIAAGILLFKVILEVWALYGKFPEKLKDFRKDYWGLLARTITNLILVLYGIWVLYCIYQLTSGDSWAAKVLAAVTLVVFTGILLFFGLRIMHLARKYKKIEGDTSGLFENKETWRKYSLFYDSYKKDYWWLFIPAIAYMFAKGCVIAGANGHGLVQSAGQLIVEALMLGLLLWNRPYVAKSSQWINITIQVVRVLSVACVLVFVEELGVSQTTKTVTGIVLIAVQSGLTGILAILIAVNAIIMCVRENPHAKRQREAEKLNRDMDDLTPLDARESLLMDHPPRRDYGEMSKFNFNEPYHDQYHPRPRHSPTESTDRLVEPNYRHDHHDRSLSRDSRPRSRDSHGSPERHHATTPGYGFAY